MSIAEAHRHAKQVITDSDTLDFVQTLLDCGEIAPGAVLDHNFEELKDLVRRQLKLRQAKNIPLWSGLVAKYASPLQQEAGDTARLAKSVFILMAGADARSIQPTGTAFAVSSRHVLTAAHNLIDTDRELYLVKMVVSDKFFKKIVVERTSLSSDITDWSILRLAEQEQDLPYVPDFATLEELPQMTGGKSSEVRAIHAPMAKYNTNDSMTIEVENESFQRISKYDFLGTKKEEVEGRIFKEGEGVPTSAREHPDAHFLLVAGSLSKGSCGAPYFNHEGKVVAMHLSSMDDAMTIRDVLSRVMKKRKSTEAVSGAKKKKTSKKDEVAEALNVSHLEDDDWESTTSAFHDVKVGLVLCKEPTVAAALKSLE